MSLSTLLKHTTSNITVFVRFVYNSNSNHMQLEKDNRSTYFGHGVYA